MVEPPFSDVIFRTEPTTTSSMWSGSALFSPVTPAKNDLTVISAAARAGGAAPPKRGVVLGRDLQPGDTYAIAVFGINGPISASPANYIWLRTATIDFYESQRARPAWPVDVHVGRRNAGLDEVIGPEPSLERVAGGFEITNGPVWAPDGGLLFSSPSTNAIYRWDPAGAVSLFRTKSGYRGVDIGTFEQPGSSGLTFDSSGRLVICQHGNRRIIRVEPHGNVTVLADRYQGRRLNSPHDLVYRSDGLLYFTDPPFGLPDRFDDPDRDLDFSGVFMVKDGEVTLIDDSLAAPSGLAFSPDGRFSTSATATSTARSSCAMRSTAAGR